MKLYRKHGAIIVESPILVGVAGFLSLGKKGYRDAKAAAFFPFVFVKSWEYAAPVFVNHERIHFRQQMETLFIGMYFIQIYEDLYSRLFLKLKAPEYYLYRAHEQEAYLNQANLNYLKTRKIFSLFKHTKQKQRIRFIEGQNPLVEIY